MTSQNLVCLHTTSNSDMEGLYLMQCLIGLDNWRKKTAPPITSFVLERHRRKSERSIAIFLTREYGKHQLKQSDGDILHCCTFALGGKCKHEHQGNHCTKCLTCFSSFQNKVLILMRNVNDAISSNENYEVDTMKAAVPKLSKAVTHYASHHLCANVQFSKVDEIMQLIKTETSIIYMVPEYK